LAKGVKYIWDSGEVAPLPAVLSMMMPLEPPVVVIPA
jgi:hypothetical protein